MERVIGWAAGLGVALLLPSIAYGHPGDVAKRGRVLLDFETAYWVGKVTLPNGTRPLSIGTDQVGILGVRRVPLGLGLAWAASDRFILGARIDAALEPRKDNGQRLLTVRGAVSPFLEILFLRQREVRPFVQLRGGIGRALTFERKQGTRSFEEVAAERTMYPTVGIGLGTHVFLSEELSLDAIITVDHRWNFRQPRPPSDGGSDATVQVRDGGSTFQAEGWRLRDSSLTAAVVFGFSRWW